MIFFIQTQSFKSRAYTLLLILTVTFSACKGSSDENPAPIGKYNKGVFIVNEGITTVSGSISFWNLDSNKVTNDIYQKENAPLVQGIYTQSMYLHEDKAYICVDNAEKILVVDNQTFKQVAEIQAEKPRYFVANGTKGYATEWKSGYSDPEGGVAVIDLNTHTITKRIKTGAGPDAMLILKGKLYVANKAENTLAIIDLQTETAVIKTVDDGPQNLVPNAAGDLWVMHGGKVTYGPAPDYKETVVSNSSLVKYETNTSEMKETKRFSFNAPGATSLISNPAKNTLFYVYQGNTYEIQVTADNLPTTPYLKRGFYGIGIDPSGSTFYGADPGSFATNGKVVRYTIATKAPIDSATVGVVPNGFVFR